MAKITKASDVKHHYGKIDSIEPIKNKGTKATFVIYFWNSRTKCEVEMLIFKKTHKYTAGQWVRIITNDKGYMKPGGIPTKDELKKLNQELIDVANDFDHLF